MSEVGFCLIHRSLLGHPEFRNDGESMAFAWLVLRAAWKPARVRYKGKTINLDRGQLSLSVRDFAAAIDRPKGWVERLLKRLENGTMVKTHCETGVTVLTICNYDRYQAQQDSSRTVGETPDETDAGHRTKKGTNNKEQDSSFMKASPSAKKASKRCPDGWLPNESDYAAGEPLSFDQMQRELEKFRDYEFPKARSDWSATFRNWLRNAAERKPANGPAPSTKLDHLDRVASAMATASQWSEPEYRGDRFDAEPSGGVPLLRSIS